MSSKQIRVGQRWRREDGSVVTIEEDDLSDRDAGVAPIRADGNWYSRAGKAYSIGACDLIELIEDAPGEPQPQASTPFAVRYYNVPSLETGHESVEAAVKHAVSIDKKTVGIVRAEFVDGKMAAVDFVPLPPPKQYVWVNVYKQEGVLKSTHVTYPSKESADRMAVPGRFGRMKIELEARWDE